MQSSPVLIDILFNWYQREQRSQCGNWNITQRVTLLFRTSAIIAAGTISFSLPIHFQWQVSIWRGAIQCLPTELWYSSASGGGDRRDYSYPHTGHRDYLRPQSIHQFPSGRAISSNTSIYSIYPDDPFHLSISSSPCIVMQPLIHCDPTLKCMKHSATLVCIQTHLQDLKNRTDESKSEYWRIA